MADFSTILQSPEIRAIVQENILERAFHDALFPKLLFRGEASPQMWPANVGDTMVFTGVGLMKPKLKPLVPGQDPLPSDYTKEQWTAQIQQYADTIDTHMPTSIVAIANLFLRNSHQLGLSAGQTLNRIVRDRMYNAALSGNTVAPGTQTGVLNLRVERLNGFTTARNPSLVSGSPVRFDFVSGSNPLPVRILSTTGEVQRNVVGFIPDIAGDLVGPGVLILDVAVDVAPGAGPDFARAYVIANDASPIVRVGGGLAVDNVGPGDTLKLSDLRSAVARFRQQNVPEFPDGRFHCHLDPISETQIFADPEFQRLLTSLPDYYIYRQFAIGELLGCVFFRNNECPQVDTVEGGSSGLYSQDDPFAGELFNKGTPAASTAQIHRPIFVGQGGILEYYQDMQNLITEAGITGRVGEPRITNNGIEVYTDRIQLIIRSPLNRLQDLVSTSWKFIGDWPVRTDAASGDAARYKRMVCIEHGAA